jgi:hypothetical protein
MKLKRNGVVPVLDALTDWCATEPGRGPAGDWCEREPIASGGEWCGTDRQSPAPDEMGALLARVSPRRRRS